MVVGDDRSEREVQSLYESCSEMVSFGHYDWIVFSVVYYFFDVRL